MSSLCAVSNQANFSYVKGKVIMVKLPYAPPTVELIPIASSTLNNSSGGGDGDAALANS
jgi:hypothetical protein